VSCHALPFAASKRRIEYVVIANDNFWKVMRSIDESRRLIEYRVLRGQPPDIGKSRPYLLLKLAIRPQLCLIRIATRRRKSHAAITKDWAARQRQALQSDARCAVRKEKGTS
jgi:hypothetical protein